MRIAYLSTDFGVPVFGNKGASIHVRALASALVAAGHEVEIFTCRAGGNPPTGFAIPVHEIPLDDEERMLVAALQDDPEGGVSVAREVRSMVFAASFARRARPMLDRFRPDALYERHAILGTAGMKLARDLGIPHLLEVNAPLGDEHVTHRAGAFGQTLRAMEQRVLASASTVIAVSEPLRQWIIDTGVHPDRVVTVPNGVDLAQFSPLADGKATYPGLDRDRPVVGFTGTLKPWHGAGTLVRAFARVTAGRTPRPQLLIVGDGPMRAELEVLASALGIGDDVVFTGITPHAAIPGFLQFMDIAVVPYDELPNPYFSPLKLFEYMAAGRPIVAASIGQAETVLHDGEDGLLYAPGDAAQLARRLDALLDDPDRAARLGAAALDRAQRHHGWDRNARMVGNLIEPARRSLVVTGGDRS
jgi:glycosyltransferase involved in cell wall biosynthesis